MLANRSVYAIESADDRFSAFFNSGLGFMFGAQTGARTKWSFVVFNGGVRREFAGDSSDEDVGLFLNRCSVAKSTEVQVELDRSLNRVTGVRLGFKGGPSVVVRL